jgi:type II secretory pathway component PulC
MMRFFLLIRTGIICVLLATAAIFFGYQAVEVWSGSNQPVVKKAEKKPTKRQIKPGFIYRRNPRSKDFEVIAQKDLFSSDRREKLPEKSPRPAPVKAAQSLDKRFVLFGILITGDEKKALVANLDNKSAQEKAHIWVKAGDKIGNLSVSEIRPEQVIITQGGRTYTIRLSEQSEFQRRVRGRKKKKPNEPTTTIIKKQKDKRPAAKRSKTSS